MARGETLRRAGLARRRAEVLAVMVDEIPTDGLTAEEAGDLVEARDLLCTTAKALRRLMSGSTPSSAE